MRRLAVLIATVAVVLVVVPYAVAPLYRFIDPISTPMLWRWVTGARVEQIAVPLDRISPALQLAVIVAEDGSFCRNHGIDLGAMREALQQSGNVGEARGASTITQQTVKNLFLWQGRSFVRKALEIPLALWVNLVLPKRRILEIYLNIAQWGPASSAPRPAHAGRSANRRAILPPIRHRHLPRFCPTRLRAARARPASWCAG